MPFSKDTNNKIKQQLRNLLRRMYASENVVIEEIIDDIAKRIEKIVLTNSDKSPQWVPPRYYLPNDRISKTATLTIAPNTDEELTWYVTLGYYLDGNLGEIFVRQDKEGGTIGSLLDAVATVTSIALQHGVPWQIIAEKLAWQRFNPSGMTLDKDSDLKFANSTLDYLARWVSKRTKLNNNNGDDQE